MRRTIEVPEDVLADVLAALDDCICAPIPHKALIDKIDELLGPDLPERRANPTGYDWHGDAPDE